MLAFPLLEAIQLMKKKTSGRDLFWAPVANYATLEDFRCSVMEHNSFCNVLWGNSF